MQCPSCTYSWDPGVVSGVQPQPQQIPYKYSGALPIHVAQSYALQGVDPVTKPTREEWEREKWDKVQAEFNSWQEPTRLMIYFLLNRNGYRMDGIEKKIEVLMAEHWKEVK